MGIAIQPDLSGTPHVQPRDLQKALAAAVALGRDQPDERWLDLFYQAIEALWPNRNEAIAHWARARALAGFLNQPATVELDSLRRQELAVRQASGASIDIEATMRMEYSCRVVAAARHPLTTSGAFADGFPQAVSEILDFTLETLETMADPADSH